MSLCRSRRGGGWSVMLLLAVSLVYIALAAPVTATAAAEPTSSRCAAAVKSYLTHTLSRRAAAEEWESRARADLNEARADLNEARSLLAEERGGQRAAHADTQQKINAAWSRFEAAAAALRSFDESVLRTHGNLTHECILEVESQRLPLGGTDTWLERMFGMVVKAVLHARLFTETLRGVVMFNVAEYESAVEFYKDVVDFFSVRSRAVEDEIQLRKKNRSFEEENGGLLEVAEFTLMYAKVVTYSFVPWITLSCVVFLLVVFAPFIISAILFQQLLWRVWIQLFFMHYVYGTTVDGYLISLRQYVDLVMRKDWEGLGERLSTAFFTLASPERSAGTFFSGILAAALVVTTVIGLLVLIYYWVKIPCALVAPEVEEWRRRKVLRQFRKGSATPPNEIKESRSLKNTSNGKESSSLAAGSGRRNQKMEASQRGGGGGGHNNNNSGNSNNNGEKNRKKKS